MKEEKTSTAWICASLYIGGAFVGLLNVIVSTSPADRDGMTGGGLDAMAETMPGQHASAPAVLFSCAAHGVHDEIAVAFITFEYVLGGHTVQLPTDDCPVFALYVPAGQAVTAPP